MPAFQSGDAESLHQQGLDALRARNYSAAVDLISRAIDLAPTVARYHTNRGEAHRAAGNLAQAAADHRRAIELEPANATAHYNLAIVLKAQHQPDLAAASYREAIRHRPDYAKAHYNLANLLRAEVKLDEAEAEYRAALSAEPNYPEALNNLGEMLAEQMRIDEAIKAFERVLSIRPDHAGAHFNRGFLNLLLGNYPAGWAEYEWRWRTPTYSSSVPNFPQPMWDGSDLRGKAILLLGEQGAGDTIQFARYATVLSDRGANVIVHCQAPVAPLIATVPGVKQVVSGGNPLPAFDCWAAMLSVPRIVGTTLDTVPANVPYISADPGKIEAWRSKLAPHRRRLNVGLSWAGNPNQANDRNRSARLNQLKPLAELADTAIFSLQKGEPTNQIAPGGFPVIDLSSEIIDFSDTAAIIANLDVTVSVCTSVAHVAGAMGKPVFTMLCYNADWRWLMNRSDSPWYPTMTLIRQTAQGEWADVARRVCEELRSRLK